MTIFITLLTFSEKIAWYLGDTTESIKHLADGIVDVAVTYNEAAEEAALMSGIATKRVYAFRVSSYCIPTACSPLSHSS